MTAALRARMACVFDGLGTERARAFGSFVRGDGEDAPPCWGSLADAFETAFEGDDERLALLEAVVDVGSAPALLLILDASRTRPRVLAAALGAARALSAPLQCAIVAVLRGAGSPPDAAALATLHPAARELAAAPEGPLARELALFAGRVGALRAMRVRAARESHSPNTG